MQKHKRTPKNNTPKLTNKLETAMNIRVTSEIDLFREEKIETTLSKVDKEIKSE